MNTRVLLVTRFRDLGMKVADSIRDALTIVHVAWLSDAIRRPARRNADGVGRHLLEMFQIIDATTRERVVPRIISGMAVVIHDLTEVRARARTLAYPAEHDVLTPFAAR